MRASQTSALLIGAAAALACLSCDRSPTAPSAVLPRPPAVDLPTSIEIVGPRSIAPGRQQAYQAIGTMPNGETRDLTAVASWRVTNSSVLVPSGAASFTAQRTGEATIQAAYGTTASIEVVIVPDGTYRLIGRVVEADTIGVGIQGATVSTAGIAPVTTAFGGLYRLYGVPPTAEILVSKDGYVAQSRHVVLANHAMEDFRLALAAPRPDLTGTFTLSIAVAVSCQARIPEEFWTRRYTATLEQSGPQVAVALSNAAFASIGDSPNNRFGGLIEPGRLTLTLYSHDDFFYYDWWPPSLIEQTSSSTFFAAGGRATGEIAGGRVEGTLQGTITIYEGTTAQMTRQTHFCNGQHAFSLTR